MSTIYQNLRTGRQYKAATALSKQQFELLFVTFDQLYIPKPALYKKEPVLTDKREALFFVLHYYKAYPSLENLTLYFGFAQSTAVDYLRLLGPLLKASLQAHQPLQTCVFKTRQAFEQAFAHTRKWLIVTDRYKRILFCGPATEGSTHDFPLFKSLFRGFSFHWLTVWVDLGFLGIDKHIRCPNLLLPLKAYKHRPLDETDKECNSIISSVRVKVEHTIANLKAFFILRHKNRMRIESKLDDVFFVCASLANFRLANR